MAEQSTAVGAGGVSPLPAAHLPTGGTGVSTPPGTDRGLQLTESAEEQRTNTKRPLTMHWGHLADVDKYIKYCHLTIKKNNDNEQWSGPVEK